MKTQNERLLEWAINKIETEYKNDVALLIGDFGFLEGHSDKSTGCFDYFVPATEKALSLSKTFIIDGTGYDLYPRSWERLENMAKFDDNMPTILLNGTILYARSDEDIERFKECQKKLLTNLKNPGFTYPKSLEKLSEAMQIYQTLMFEENLGRIRMGAGYISDYLANSIALLNGTYLKNDCFGVENDIAEMSLIPENFISYYNAIIKAETANELKNLSYMIIMSVRKLLDERKPAGTAAEPKDLQGLAWWYEELSHTWKNIYAACDSGNTHFAFVRACYLQGELDIVAEEFGIPGYDFFSSFSAKNLTELKKEAKKAEEHLLSLLKEQNIKINKYNNVDEFLSTN